MKTFYNDFDSCIDFRIRYHAGAW